MKKQILALGFGLLALQLTAMQVPQDSQRRLDDKLWQVSQIAFSTSNKQQRVDAKKKMWRLLKKGANPNSRRNGETLMHLFAKIGSNRFNEIERGDGEDLAVEILHTFKANVDAKDEKGFTPHYYADKLNKREIAFWIWEMSNEMN